MTVPSSTATTAKRGACIGRTQFAKGGVDLGDRVWLRISAIACGGLLHGAHACHRHVFEVSPRAEVTTSTPQHDHTHRIGATGSGLRLLQHLPQFRHHL